MLVGIHHNTDTNGRYLAVLGTYDLLFDIEQAAATNTIVKPRRSRFPAGLT